MDTDGSGEIEFDEWAVMFGAGDGGGDDDDGVRVQHGSMCHSGRLSLVLWCSPGR